MSVSSVRLRNFRRYDDVTLSFGPGTTFLEGENNAGKTTVFYAIEYALFGRVGTVLGPADLIRPKADGVGVELCFTGRDGRRYRLQRVHLRPPGSRTRVVGHFTLWVRDPGEESAQRYLLSSDFDDLETDLALVVQQALGVTKRGWDLAVHLRQGHIPDILDGSPQLDIVLGVTSAVFVEEELRVMALEREKAAGELPALEATLQRLKVEREARRARLEAIQTEQTALEEKHAGASEHARALQAELDALSPLRRTADALAEAEQRAGPPIDGRAAEAAVTTLEGKRAELREALGQRREQQSELERGRGDLLGRLQRRQAMDGVAVCDHCGQAVEPAHLAAQIPELQAALADVDGQLAALASEAAADEAALAGLEEELAEARSLVRAAAEAAAAAEALTEARAAAREHVEADDETLLATLRERFEAERDRLRAAQVRLQADVEHGAARLQQLASEQRDATTALRALEREHAETETRCQALRADFELAARLRALGKAFKQVQQDLREQATAAMAERTLAIHRHLSGDDKELKDVVVDPKRYVVHVTPRDIGKRVPAGHAQGGGHRLLLGLAARLALAEQLGPVPFILLDEPTYGLDLRRREALLGRISELNVAEQLLLITHHDVGSDRDGVVKIVRDGATSRPEVA